MPSDVTPSFPHCLLASVISDEDFGPFNHISLMRYSNQNELQELEGDM